MNIPLLDRLSNMFCAKDCEKYPWADDLSSYIFTYFLSYKNSPDFKNHVHDIVTDDTIEEIHAYLTADRPRLVNKIIENEVKNKGTAEDLYDLYAQDNMYLTLIIKFRNIY